MTAQEFEGWKAFYRIAAPGEIRLEFLLAGLCTLVANAHFKKKGGGQFRPIDFVMDLRTPEERLAVELKRKQAEAEFAQMVKEAREKFGSANVLPEPQEEGQH